MKKLEKHFEAGGPFIYRNLRRLYLFTKWSFNSKVQETVKYSKSNEKSKLKKQVIRKEKNSPSFLLMNNQSCLHLNFKENAEKVHADYVYDKVMEEEEHLDELDAVLIKKLD